MGVHDQLDFGMRKKKAISLFIIIGMAILILISIRILLRPNEQDRLIARAFHAQERITSDYHRNVIDIFMDNLRGSGYWIDEYERIRDELVNKGYFKKVEFTLPTSQFSEAWKSLWTNTDEDRLMFYTYSPYTPDQPESTIILIGPPETVNKKLKLLKENQKQ